MEPIRALHVATHFRQVQAADKDGVMRDDMWQKCAPGVEGATAMAFADVPPEKLAEPPVSPSDFEAAIAGTRPSVAAKDLIPFDEWTELYGQDGSQERAGADTARGGVPLNTGGSFGASAVALEHRVMLLERQVAAAQGEAGSAAPQEPHTDTTLAASGSSGSFRACAAELERRVELLERHLAAAQGGGGDSAVSEGEPHADIMLPTGTTSGTFAACAAELERRVDVLERQLGGAVAEGQPHATPLTSVGGGGM